MTPPRTENPLFFLDYDGTLAPIIDNPAEARPHPDVPSIVKKLDGQYRLYIVTGRYPPHLGAFLDFPVDVIGLHGVQRGRLHGELSSVLPNAAQEAIEHYRRTAPTSDHIRLEEKGPMFALHYRQASDKAAAQKAIRDWLGEVPDVLDPIWGKDVVELRPAGVSKGTAVKEIAERHPNMTPIYIGDDVTDEDAFEALGDDAITIKVGDGESAARFRLATIEDVVAYLEGYLDPSQ